MLTKEDRRLFLALVAWALLPSLYALVRMQLVAVNGVDLNILGQMEWFDLIDEVLVSTLTVPLYSLLKPKAADGGAGTNAAALLVSFAVYAAFTALAVRHIAGISAYMNAVGAERYLAMQALSLLVGFAALFGILLLTINADVRAVQRLTLIRLASLAVLDAALIAAWGDMGAAYAELASNAAVAAAVLTLCVHRGYLAKPEAGCGAFFAAWARRGVFVGAQIFLDNFIYAVMICRMVNAVHESGGYWVANNFIWGWLLVPVTCFAELIRKNDLDALTVKNAWRYGVAMAGLWAASVPLWRWFIHNAMAIADADAILRIIYPSVVFYLAYIPSAFLDAWFVSKGKTWCLTVISAVVNLVYYGALFALFRKGVFTPSMAFIIQMFGWGMVVHLLLSAGLYRYAKKQDDSRFGN